MAYYFDQPSRTFGEYLLVPGFSSGECIPANVDLRTPLVRYKKGEEPAITLNIPMVSAIMQAVSNDTMAIALAKEGGVSFIFGSQSIESEAAMVSRVKNYKKGFIVSTSNLTPDDTLADVLTLKERTGHSTVAITDDGTANGKLLGIVGSKDYRVSRMDPTTKVKEFMTPREKLITAPDTTSLKDANDIIWENKLNNLPLVDENDHLAYLVFRKDYDSHHENVLELLDEHKSYIVGAGINSRDYEERVPALVEAGADVLCIDSSEGYSEWQKRTLQWIKGKYGDSQQNAVPWIAGPPAEGHVEEDGEGEEHQEMHHLVRFDTKEMLRHRRHVGEIAEAQVKDCCEVQQEYYPGYRSSVLHVRVPACR